MDAHLVTVLTEVNDWGKRNIMARRTAQMPEP